MALSQEKIRAAYERANPAVMRTALAIMEWDDTSSADLSTGIKANTYLKLVAAVRGKGMSDNDADDAASTIWSKLSGMERRTLVNADADAIVAMVASAAMSDLKLANKLNPGGAQDVKLASLGGDGPYYRPTDPLLRNTQFDRDRGAVGVGGMDRGSQYTDLSTTGYNAAYPGRPWKLSEGGYQQYGFSAVGLNFSAAQDMANQGFSPESIKAAAKLTGALGIDVNQNAAAVARLKRDIPNIEPALKEGKANWEAVGKLLEDERKALARGDHDAADKARKAADEARKKAEEHDRKELERVKKTKPERIEDLERVQNAVKRRGLGLIQGITADKNEQREIEAAVDTVRRDPSDAEAQKKLAALREKHGRTKEAQAAFAALEKETGVKLNETVDIGTEQRAEEIAQGTALTAGQTAVQAPETAISADSTATLAGKFAARRQAPKDGSGTPDVPVGGDDKKAADAKPELKDKDKDKAKPLVVAANGRAIGPV